MSKRPLVFLDTETTGLGPTRQAWEVAMVRREPDGTQRSVDFFLHADVSHAEPGALDIGRYYERHPNGRAACFTPPPPGVPPLVRRVPAPPQEPVLHASAAAEVIAQWTSGATIVGANPAFDADVLAKLLRANRYEPRWHYRLRDVESMVCAITDADMGGLRACADAMGVTVDPALEHTAMGDVRTTMRIWDAIILIGEQVDAVFAPALAAEAAADDEPVTAGEVPPSPATIAAARGPRPMLNHVRPAYRTETGGPR